MDQTGLENKGKFDFDVIFMPDDSMFGVRFRSSADTMDKAAPGFFTALADTTGLKLVPEKLPSMSWLSTTPKLPRPTDSVTNENARDSRLWRPHR